MMCCKMYAKLLAVLVMGTCCILASGAAISVNMVAVSSDGINPDPAILAPTETAGLVSAPNWNNWELSKIWNSIPTANMTFTGLIDDSGATTSAQVVYSQTANHSIASSATYDYTPTDEKLFRRYVDQWGNGRSSSYVVMGLPTSITEQGYNVIVYTSSPANLDSRAGTYKIDDGDDGTFDQTQYVWGGANPYSSEAGYVEQTYSSLSEAQSAYLNGNAEGNYIMFTGLTSDSFELEIAVGSGSTPQRAPFNGFQIVAVPEPTTITLLGLGLVPLLRRKKM